MKATDEEMQHADDVRHEMKDEMYEEDHDSGLWHPHHDTWAESNGEK